MKRNTLDFKEFIFYSLLMNIIAYLIYRNIFFKAIGNLTVSESHGVLGGIVLIVFLINLAITGDWGKNEKAVMATTILSYGIYTFVAYAKLMKTAYMWTWVITGVIIAAYLILIFGHRISNTNNRRKIMRIRNRRGYEGVRNIAACAGVAFTVIAFVQTSVVGGITSSQVKGTAVYGDEYALAENIDMFLYLQPEEWDKLGDDLDTKLAILSTVLNTEGRYLGFNKKITLYTKDLDEGTLGYFSPSDNSIFLDTNHILKDSSREVLESLLHECFHVSQHQYADLYNSLSDEDKNMYFLMNAKEFAEEFDSYVNGNTDYIHYYSQSCESTARSYGKSAAEVIFNRIDLYLSKHESN